MPARLREGNLRAQMNVCRVVLALGVVALLTGCAPTYTNLTPRNAARTGTDVYHFEVQWDISRRGANGADVQGFVVIEESLYPLQRVAGTPNRWEADVPVPRDKAVVPYRYKFDYTYPTITRRLPNSDYSPPYFLDLSRPVPQFVPPGP